MENLNWVLLCGNRKIVIRKSIFTFGRQHSADIVSKTTVVSRNHAKFWVTAEGLLFVQDLNSVNGTLVNDERIRSMDMHPLHENDKISFGGTMGPTYIVKKEIDEPEIIEIEDDDEDEQMATVSTSAVDATATTSAVDAEDQNPQCSEPTTPETDDKSSILNQLAHSSTSTVAVENGTAVAIKIEQMEQCDNSNIEIKNGDTIMQEDKKKFCDNDDNEIYTISDDDDDDGFACSQIFQLDKKIKQEQKIDYEVQVENTDFHQDFDPFLHIKTELQELDLGNDILNVVPINLEEDLITDNFDLENLLKSQEDREESELNKNNEDVDTDDELPPLEEKENEHCIPEKSLSEIGIQCSSSQISKSTANYSEMQGECSKTNGNCFQENDVAMSSPSNNNQLHDTLMNKTLGVSTLYKKPNKYNKLTIIEPHVQVKRRTSNANKRKSLDKSPTTNSKKKCSEFKIPRSKSSDSKEDRKKKLKEISEKEKVAESDKQKSITKAKVKCSESRGTFLLAPAPPVKVKAHTSIKSTSTSKSKTLRKVPFRSKLAEAVQNNDTPITEVTTVIRNELTQINVNVGEPLKINVGEPLKISVCEPLKISVSEPLKNNVESLRVNRSGFIWNTINLQENEKRFTEVNIDDVIHRMLSWSSKWLEEQGGSQSSPPVNSSTPVNMFTFFKSYADYYANVTPLIFLEVWQSTYRELVKYSRDPFHANVSHSRNVKDKIFLDCEYYIDEEDSRKNNFPKINDFSLLELKLTNAKNNRFSLTAFALITEVNRVVLTSDAIIDNLVSQLISPKIPHTKIKFTLITKQWNTKLTSGNIIVLKIIYNVSSYFQLFKTIKNLNNSPISKLIFNPNVQDYIPIASEQKLVFKTKLSTQQKNIVLEACEMCLKKSPGIYLIHGPPGTGKSTIITSIVMQLLLNDRTNQPKILLVAPSNAAIDNLVVKLMKIRNALPAHRKRHIKLIRTGPDMSIGKEAQKCTLTNFALANLSARFNTSDLELLRRKLGPRYAYELRVSEDTFVLGSNLVATTLNSCQRLFMYYRRGQLKFDCCIIDEATQATEVESLLPTQLGITNFVLVGDPKQLNASVFNMEAKHLGFERSLFSRISQCFQDSDNNPIRMLEVQYRMAEEICKFPSKAFYNDVLKTDADFSNKLNPCIKPYLVFNIRESQCVNGAAEETYTNANEVLFIHNLLDIITTTISKECHYSIGIITPYTLQRDKILQDLTTLKIPSNVTLKVNTIDSFQGSENDIILLSCVRHASNNFLQNENRLNVALTRAKQCLYIIGNYNLFKHTKTLYDLREDAKMRHRLVDVTDLTPAFFTNLRNDIFYL